MVYTRNQVALFVILFNGRTGSTLLTEMLDTQPGVQAVSEVFSAIKTTGQGAQAQIDWASQFLIRPLFGKYRAKGFKTKLWDVLEPDAFGALLRERQTHIIHLRRRNQVKAVVSALRADRLSAATGGWNIYSDADRLKPTPLDVDQFTGLLKRREQDDRDLDAFVQRQGLPTTAVFYEELLTDANACLQRVCQALGFSYQPTPVMIKKHTSDNLHNDVTNLAELKALYAGTPYEAMFDEVLVTD